MLINIWHYWLIKLGWEVTNIGILQLWSMVDQWTQITHTVMISSIDFWWSISDWYHITQYDQYFKSLINLWWDESTSDKTVEFVVVSSSVFEEYQRTPINTWCCWPSNHVVGQYKYDNIYQYLTMLTSIRWSITASLVWCHISKSCNICNMNQVRLQIRLCHSSVPFMSDSLQ